MVTFFPQLCVASRALETYLLSPPRLYTDPYAELLAGPEALLRARVRLAGNTQLVLLAAGLETRAFRLYELSNQVALFEVDRQEVVGRKERLLAEVETRPQVRAGSRTVVDADLAQATWTCKIEEAGMMGRLSPCGC